LVVRIDNKQYYEWTDAQAIVMSYLVFHTSLPLESMPASINSKFLHKPDDL
jgi:hypothetical protein